VPPYVFTRDESKNVSTQSIRVSSSDSDEWHWTAAGR